MTWDRSNERCDDEQASAFVCYRLEMGDAAVCAGRCHWCGEIHAHGAAEGGLRARKCRHQLSPGRNQSIALDVRGNVGSLDDIEAAPFASIGRSLCPALEEAAEPLRKAIVTAAIGAKKLSHWTRRRVGRLTVDVFDFGERWWLLSETDRVDGQGALHLLANLSGASIGAVTVMVLRLLGLGLGASDLRQIQAFIDIQLRSAGEGRRA